MCVIKTIQYALHRAKVTVGSEVNTEVINKLSGQNVKFKNIKNYGESTNKQVLKF